MSKDKKRIAFGLKYFWVNYLSSQKQLKVLSILSRANKFKKTTTFNNLISDFKRVLIILPENSQEVLLAQKSIIALKEHSKNIEIDVVAEVKTKDIIKSNPNIDGGFFYVADEFCYNHPAFNELTYGIKNKEYDICFIMNRYPNPLSYYLAVKSGAPLRVGFVAESSNAALFINLGIRPKADVSYEGDYFDSLIRTIGVKLSKSRLNWEIPKSTEKDVEGLLVESGYKIEQSLIGIDISPSINSHKFPISLIKSLIEELANKKNFEIILFYSKDTKQDISKEFSDISKNIVPISEDNISFAASFVYKCDLIISLNNLIYQLSILLNRPVIGLFENKERERWSIVEKSKFEAISEKRLKDIKASDIIEKVDSIISNK